MFGQIKLDKLVLRNFKESDYLDIFEYFKDPKICYYNNFKPLKTTIDAKLLINNFNERDAHAIVLKEAKKVIGHFLTRIKNFDYYIEFSINPSYAGNGYLSQVLNYFVSQIKAPKVYALIHEENIETIAFLEKNGFELVEEFRNEDVNHDVVNFKKYVKVK